MKTHLCVALCAVLLSTLACSDANSPGEASPETIESNIASTSALDFWQMSAGGYHSCGVTTENRAYCWGYNQTGQLGTGSNHGPELCTGAVGPFPCSTRPVPVAGGLRFRQISAGWLHTCAVTTSAQLYCWGTNWGALGDGTIDERDSPVAVAGGRQFLQVDAGYSHTCAVTTDRQVFCWGSNSRGELGDGTMIQRLRPVAVRGALRFKQVSAGLGHYGFTCGVATDSRAYCWGSNNFGQVGDSSEARRRLRPSLVSGGQLFSQVDAGYYHACGVSTSSRAFCWGNGQYGELGTGRKYLSFWPRPVKGGLAFGRVTAGQGHSCGETTGNRAYCWGLNTYGELGDGTTTSQVTPVAVSGALAFAQLNAGGLHTCGKTLSGVGYCWGYDFFAQLGDGHSSFEAKSSVPVRVLGPN